MPTSTMPAPAHTPAKPFRWRQTPPGVAVGPRSWARANPTYEDLRDNRHAWTGDGLISNLAAEWTVTANTNRAMATVRSWATKSPALQGYTHAVDVLIDIDSGNDAAKDAQLAALISLAQGGDRFASRTVLQAMLPKLRRLARYGTVDRREDRGHITVSAFLTVLGSYPLDRRPTCIAGNLSLETLHALTQNRRTTPVLMEIPVGDHAVVASIRTVHGDRTYPDLAAQPCSGNELNDVLTWAVNTGTVTAAAAELLAAVYAPEPGHPGGHGPVAADLGLTPAAVRQRCSRATRSIRHAVLHAIEAQNAA